MAGKEIIVKKYVVRLSGEEREWLDSYHARVREEIAPMVDGDVRAWLEAATQPL